jgi:hypothetical protein
MLSSARARLTLGSLISLLFSASWVLSATEPSGVPGRLADYVFVVMLDGTRPDVLREANAPVIHRLGAEGVQYLQATTIYPSQTRVAFVSLPTGAYPEKHGIVGGDEIKDARWQTITMGNDDPVAAQALVACPTFFEEATAAGLTSLYAAMKGYELVGARGATWTINGKQTLNGVAYPTRYQSEVSGSADLAAGYKQLLSTELLDQALDVVRSRRPNLVVMRIPLILSGAGVARGRVLGKASLVDVAPTVLRLLGIRPRLLQADGRTLEEALEAPAGTQR